MVGGDLAGLDDRDLDDRTARCGANAVTALGAAEATPSRVRISGWMRVPKSSIPCRKSSNTSMMPFVPSTAAASSSIAATCS